MNHEHLLLSKTIQDRNILPLVDSRVTREWFLDPACQRVFDFLLEYKAEYNEVPTVGALHKNFPSWEISEVDEPFAYLIDELRKARTYALLTQGVDKAIDHLKAKPRRLAEAQTILGQHLSRVGIEVSNQRDTDLTKTRTERLSRYKEYENLDGNLRGLPLGFPTIDNITLGLQPQQLITMVGPPAAGKSTLLLIGAKNIHKLCKPVMFLGFEMSNEEQEERYDAVLARVSHRRLRSGTLRADEWLRLERETKALQDLPPFILSGDISGATTLSGVAAKLDQYQPSILFVDGIYMMQDEHGEKPGSPQALTNLTRGFKRMARKYQICIVITTQVLEWKMNKGAITSNSIGYSSSFMQDSDVIIGCEKVPDDDDIRLLKTIKSRNSASPQVYVRWDWETGEFTELNEYVAELTQTEF